MKNQQSTPKNAYLAPTAIPAVFACRDLITASSDDENWELPIVPDEEFELPIVPN